ncbi:MAG: hypothetical protein NTV54_11190 [Ignavibacteriales bacterium]|nr:hypothetical protein [Ignavibacteriales bacterium]
MELLAGPAVTIRLQPEIPAGMLIKQVLVGGKKIHFNPATERGILAEPIVVRVSSNSEVLFHHTRGVGLIPITPMPQPGDSALGERIIAASFDGKKYTVTVEGVAGTEAIFQAMVFDQPIPTAEGCVIEKSAVPGRLQVHVQFGGSTGSIVRTSFSLSF